MTLLIRVCHKWTGKGGGGEGSYEKWKEILKRKRRGCRNGGESRRVWMPVRLNKEQGRQHRPRMFSEWLIQDNCGPLGGQWQKGCIKDYYPQRKVGILKDTQIKDVCEFLSSKYILNILDVAPQCFYCSASIYLNVIRSQNFRNKDKTIQMWHTKIEWGLRVNQGDDYTKSLLIEIIASFWHWWS